VEAGNAVFSKIPNTGQTFWVAIILVNNLLERLNSVPLYTSLRLAGFQLNQDSRTFFLRDETNIDLADTTTKLDFHGPARGSEAVHGS
jgi:hypothetical protein